MITGIAIVLSAGWLSGSTRADNWPQWRGPAANGVSHTNTAPEHWSQSKHVRWKQPLRGAGASCPIVWEDVVVLTASEGRQHDRLHVLCFRRQDGRLLWDTRLAGSVATPQNMYPPGGMAVPTAATDGRAIYALFGTGDLVALDFAGKPRWVRSLAQENGPFMNRWGMGASPILYGQTLFVVVDHWAPSYLLAIDPATGGDRWKRPREEAVNWSSPIVVPGENGAQLVCTGTYKVKGMDPATGTTLWSIAGLEQQCIPSPVFGGQTVFAASGRKGHTLAIKLDDRSNPTERTAAQVVWKNQRGAPYVPSPVCVAGLLFLVDDNGIATCLDAATGKSYWQQRLPSRGQFQASLLAAGGNIYYTSLDGDIVVARAAPTFELVSKNSMGERIVATPAIADGQLFIRGERNLYCIATQP